MRRPALVPTVRSLLALCLTLGCGLARQALGDGPADNRADQVRPVPPPGLPVPDDIRASLSARTESLGREIEALRRDLARQPARLALLPDLEIFHKAVDWALRYNEFFKTNEFSAPEGSSAAQRLLDEGARRATALRGEPTPYWTEARGPVVRGYRSRLDGSVQPYGLVVPDTFQPAARQPYRLDFWFHGRGETLSELAFLDERMRRAGEFAPRDAFVLHPYGRYCNGSRFAGETDAWEAFDQVRARYPIDEDRLVVRGFSLGGASCWHFATHHAWRWAAAAPGAGFSETAEFLRVFQNESLKPAPWEPLLWRWYDGTAHAANVRMVPLVAYSGEKDRQIQAAQAMEKAMAEEGLALTHVIGAGMGHSYSEAAKQDLNRRLDALAAQGRDPFPRTVHFVTHTLRYPRMAWVRVDELGQHWSPARVVAERRDEGTFHIVTTNVTALTLEIEAGLFTLPSDQKPRVVLDGTTLAGALPGSDRSWTSSFHRTESGWVTGARPASGLRKRSGLQGPIDDAFMDAFLFVRPTGAALGPEIGAWTARELERAIREWRSQYRGDVRVVDDTAVTDADLASHHVVLWGDPASNALLRRIADRLPLRWDAQGVHTPAGDHPVERCVPVLIYPNPLNPERYVVLNSGFTFREYDYLNNARQTPKLPDWAVVDVRTPPTARTPGEIVSAGFFGERWEWQKPLR
ncbi:MAG: prolyl oligopeptidase family serine peptidase [Verrucomicrobiales bacterium]|nr:prolyl oligopeptidase family serine peptidase [Verrucomicrobiales bacterium]